MKGLGRAQERRTFRSATIDRYLLALVAKPLAISLGVVLMVLLLERVLRLVNLLAATGSSQYLMLAALTANLVPHYLGLALAAAFFVALFVAMIRLGDSSELDALLASGVSMRRLALPFVALGCVLACLSLLLYGFLNPISRYDYRRILDSAVNTVWQAHVPASTFINAGHDLTITADRVDVGGRRLEGVFIQQRRGDLEEITTAKSGQLALTEDGKHLKLLLTEGSSIRENASGAPRTLRFRNFTFATQFDLDPPPFRPRGSNERELTFTELWQGIRTPSSHVAPDVLKAELTERIVRSLAFPFLPLLAIPLSLASRRGSRATGLVLAAVLLVVFNNALQLGRGLAAAGHGEPVLVVAAPFLVFVALSTWLFASSAMHPTEAPVSRAVQALQGFATSLVGRTGLLNRRS